MMILSRILGVLGSLLISAAIALRFKVARERLFSMWPGSRNFIENYYPLDLNVRGKVSEAVGYVRGRRDEQTTRGRYGESLPGEAK